VWLLILLISLFSHQQIQAQDLEDFVGSYTGENGQGFMQPLGDAFGADMNSGLYHSAKIDSGFHFFIGVITTTALISNDQKTFTATTEGFFSPQRMAEVPTIFGAVEGVTVEGDAGTSYQFPGGLNLDILPIGVPQLEIGNIYGTQGTVRYIAVDLGDNFGKLTLFGWGIRHSISQYFKQAPLDISIGYFQQNFDIGNVVEANSYLAGVQAGKDVGKINFYGGVAYENATLDIEYNYDDGEQVEQIVFELEGANTVRFTAGVGLNLSVFRLFADINLSNQTVFSAGFGFEF